MPESRIRSVRELRCGVWEVDIIDTVNEVMALPEGYAGQGSELPARIRGDEKKEEAEEPAPDPKAPRPVKIISWESLACG